jgi:hypothetical protein
VAVSVSDPPGMVCYAPLKGWRSRTANPSSGKRPIVFDRSKGFADMPQEVPCGQCVGCRLERSRTWAMRCLHEASLYENNCFVTLTYNDEFVPLDGSLVLRDFQLFFKRLRKRYGSGIRFYHCGEYGPLNGRPHYHACIFNFDFDDKLLWKYSNDIPLYTSSSLDSLWCDPRTGKSLGFATVGTLTFESAAYVARYCLKKVNGKDAVSHYVRYSPDGVVYEIAPEYSTMSRRPGIGRGWLDSFASDCLSVDGIIVNGAVCKPPRYYDLQLEITDADMVRLNKRKRRLGSKRRAADNTSERLKVREKIQLSRLQRLPRKDV